MHHFTMDGFQGFRSRFDDIRLVHELLEEIPEALDVQPVMPPYMLPYYNGVVAEDCGISAFIFLAGGHLTVHTFSFRECFFADLVYPSVFDTRKLRYLLETGFPCRSTTAHAVDRGSEAVRDGETAPDRDFGPHLFLDIQGYKGPSDMEGIFRLFDELPPRIDMTPIMRPYVITGKGPTGEPVVSAMTMIAESHIALHVFPERRAAYFDIFSCRFFDRGPVVRELRSMFPGDTVREALVARGQNYTGLRREREPEVARSKGWLRALP
jgi:S-adenosylmethionine/arginine decarboxylase-like enzyme